MTPQFRIDEDGVPWAGDKALPWAKNVRNEVYRISPEYGEHYHRGFHLPSENGWTISCQWGWGNYCSNRSPMLGIDDGLRAPDQTETSPDAEIAIWDHKHNWVEFEHGDTVEGYVSVEQFLRLVIEIAQWDTLAPSSPYKISDRRSLAR